MKKLILCILLVFVFCNIRANSIFQDKIYTVAGIADSLKENSHAVIRYYNETYRIADENSLVHKVKKVTTVLKYSGKKFASLLVGYDKFSRITQIHGKLYDKYGKLLRRIKKSDIKDYSYNSSGTMYSDNRVKYIKAPLIKAPYTIEYEYEIVSRGIFSFPAWFPVPNFNISTEHSVLKIFAKKGTTIRTKEFNFSGKTNSTKQNKGQEYIREIKNLKSIDEEPFNSDYKNYVPAVKIAPLNFKYGGYRGNIGSWKNFGNWAQKLNKGRDTLSPVTINKMKELVKGIDNNFEKAKKIYEYMQSKTRYVSIQLGIGGWQPFPAATVDRVGYGDCKALSNYMKALLKTVGIKSHYTVVRAGDNALRMDKEFPSNQFNHAILCLPLENDTVWLECTSQIMPFGYISDFTDNRDVMIITENGGKIVHTTIYPADVNKQEINITANVTQTGNIEAKVSTLYSGLQYDNISGILDLSDQEKEKKLQEIISIPNMEIKSFSYKNNKALLPSIEENLELNIKKYASISSKRLFLPVNILNKVDYIPRKIQQRRTDIVLRHGYTDTDTIVYSIPKGFDLEYIPENVNSKTKFGEFSAKFEFKEGKLYYIRKRIKNIGIFPASDYEELRNYYKIMYKADKESAVFVKKGE